MHLMFLQTIQYDITPSSIGNQVYVFRPAAGIRFTNCTVRTQRLSMKRIAENLLAPRCRAPFQRGIIAEQICDGLCVVCQRNNSADVQIPVWPGVGAFPIPCAKELSTVE
jgi:hypothetical protein